MRSTAPTRPSSGTGRSDTLAFTGADVPIWLPITAGAAILAGFGLFMLTRREQK